MTAAAIRGLHRRIVRGDAVVLHQVALELKYGVRYLRAAMGCSRKASQQPGLVVDLESPASRPEQPTASVGAATRAMSPRRDPVDPRRLDSGRGARTRTRRGRRGVRSQRRPRSASTGGLHQAGRTGGMCARPPKSRIKPDSTMPRKGQSQVGALIAFFGAPTLIANKFNSVNPYIEFLVLFLTKLSSFPY